MKRIASGCSTIAFLVVLTLVTCTPATGLGQEEMPLKIPRLGEHTFVPNLFIKEPFVVSYIRNTTGAGISSRVLVPLTVLPDSTEIGGLDASIAAVIVEFEFQYAMKDWVAVWGRLSIAGRLGTNEQSLISEGVSALVGYELGWMFRLLKTEHDYLSLAVSLDQDSATVVNLLEWVQRIIEEGGIAPDNNLISSPSSLRGLVGLRYARGLSSLFGLNAAGYGGYGERLTGNKDNSLSYQLGLGLSCNFLDKHRVPLGVYLGYGISNFPATTDNFSGPSHEFNLRFGYTGFPDMHVGLDINYLILPVDKYEQTAQFTQFTISLRYFF